MCSTFSGFCDKHTVEFDPRISHNAVKHSTARPLWPHFKKLHVYETNFHCQHMHTTNVRATTVPSCISQLIWLSIGATRRKFKRTESASRWVTITTIISTESFGVRRLRITTFLVIFLHQWLRLFSLKLNKLYLVEQDTLFWQLKVSCICDNTKKQVNIGNDSVLMAYAFGCHGYHHACKHRAGKWLHNFPMDF